MAFFEKNRVKYYLDTFRRNTMWKWDYTKSNSRKINHESRVKEIHFNFAVFNTFMKGN
jgi:hypothetical protein